MIAISLIITGFSCFICIIPTIFCIYQVNIESHYYNYTLLRGVLLFYYVFLCAYACMHEMYMCILIIKAGSHNDAKTCVTSKRCTCSHQHCEIQHSTT